MPFKMSDDPDSTEHIFAYSGGRFASTFFACKFLSAITYDRLNCVMHAIPAISYHATGRPTQTRPETRQTPRGKAFVPANALTPQHTLCYIANLRRC